MNDYNDIFTGAPAGSRNLGFGNSSNPYLGKDNPYLQGQIDSTLGDMTRAWNNTTQPAYNSAMVKSGSFGNSGVQQMNQDAAQSFQTSLGRTANDFRAADYGNQQNMYKWDQEFGRGLYNDAYGQNMNNLQVGMGLLGTANGYSQQDLTNSTQIQNTPLNYYSQFSNIANGFGNAGGAQSSSMQGQGSPITGALGGWQLGSALGKSYGQSGYGTPNPSAFTNYSGDYNSLGYQP